MRSPLTFDRPGRHRLEGYDTPTEEFPVTDPQDIEPRADTAGEEDHDDPWQYASEEYVDPPSSSGER